MFSFCWQARWFDLTAPDNTLSRNTFCSMMVWFVSWYSCLLFTLWERFWRVLFLVLYLTVNMGGKKHSEFLIYISVIDTALETPVSLGVQSSYPQYVNTCETCTWSAVAWFAWAFPIASASASADAVGLCCTVGIWRQQILALLNACWNWLHIHLCRFFLCSGVIGLKNRVRVVVLSAFFKLVGIWRGAIFLFYSDLLCFTGDTGHSTEMNLGRMDKNGLYLFSLLALFIVGSCWWVLYGAWS